MTSVNNARSNPGPTSMRTAPTAITIMALDVLAAVLRVVGLGRLTLVGRTRTIRTRGALADRVARSSAVAPVAGCPGNRRSR